MKYKWLSIVFLWGALAACQDEAAVFETPVPADGITFVPVSGGAIMRYALPKNTDIYSLRVRYLDERGEELMKDGSVYADSLVLSGFNAPQRGVTARITAVDRNNVESESLERTFSTLPSVAYAFADSIRVEDSWDGLVLKANYEDMPAGERLDVFRVGINPFTKEQDTLYLADCKVAQTLNQFVEVVTDETESTIVVKTVDGNGNYVRTRVFPGVKCLATQQYPRTKLAVSDPGEYSLEQPETASEANGYTGKLGIQYLIDGDVKGEQRLLKYGDFYTYMTKRDAKGSYVVLTLEEPQVLAYVRMYAMVHYASTSAYPDPISNLEDYIPSHVKIFASNDMEQWDELAEFFQPNNPSEVTSCWSWRMGLSEWTQAEFDKAEPVFISLVCPANGTKYKYVKVQCLDHFDVSVPGFKNTSHIFTYQELEVYVQKD